jgi:hypothetical protein
MEKEF